MRSNCDCTVYVSLYQYECACTEHGLPCIADHPGDQRANGPNVSYLALFMPFTQGTQRSSLIDYPGGQRANGLNFTAMANHWTPGTPSREGGASSSGGATLPRMQQQQQQEAQQQGNYQSSSRRSNVSQHERMHSTASARPSTAAPNSSSAVGTGAGGVNSRRPATSPRIGAPNGASSSSMADRSGNTSPTGRVGQRKSGGTAGFGAGAPSRPYTAINSSIVTATGVRSSFHSHKSPVGPVI